MNLASTGGSYTTSIVWKEEPEMRLKVKENRAKTLDPWTLTKVKRGTGFDSKGDFFTMSRTLRSRDQDAEEALTLGITVNLISYQGLWSRHLHREWREYTMQSMLTPLQVSCEQGTEKSRGEEEHEIKGRHFAVGFLFFVLFGGGLSVRFYSMFWN